MEVAGLVAELQKSLDAGSSNLNELVTQVQQSQTLILSGNNLFSVLRDLSKRNHILISESNANDAHLQEALVKVRETTILSQPNEDWTSLLGVDPSTPSSRNEPLNKALVGHFLHTGLVRTAATFAKESQILVDETLVERTTLGMEALRHLTEKDIQPAIDWTCRFAPTNSALLFAFHSMGFSQLANREEALEYANKNFGAFSKTHAREVEALIANRVMGSVAQPSPTCAQLHAQLLQEVQFGMPPSLTPVLEEGLIRFGGYRRVCAANSGAADASWASMPASQEAHKACHHTELVCPVSGELATEDNPAMLLPCGHVFLRDSILKMQHRSFRNAAFKCPTCPKEFTLEALIRLRC